MHSVAAVNGTTALKLFTALAGSRHFWSPKTVQKGIYLLHIRRVPPLHSGSCGVRNENVCKSENNETDG